MATAKKNENIKKVVNVIRENASPQYQNAVPLMTAKSEITDLSNPVMSYSIVKNEFVDNLINVIGMTIFTKMEEYNSPLKLLKKGEKPLGIDVREIASELLQKHEYKLNDDLLAQSLKLEPPVLHEAFHRLNRKDYYQISISNEELRLAFDSWDSLEQLVVDKATILYNSNYVDEYKYSKDLLTGTVQKGNVTIFDLSLPSTDTTSKAYIKAIKNAVSDFKHPSTAYTQFANMEDVPENQKLTTWTKPEDSIVITTSRILNDLAVDEMAVAFNKDELAFKSGNTVDVDTLGYVRFKDDEETIHYYSLDTIVCDKAFTQIYDDLLELWEMQIASAMIFQRFLHVWQIYSTSPFVNVRSFVHEVEESDIPEGYFDGQSEDDIPVIVIH